MASATSEAWICPSGPVHPAAELLPMMPDSEIEGLGEDIASNGLLEPLVYWADNGAQKESGQHWGLRHCPIYLLDRRARLAAIERRGLPLEDLRCRTKAPQHPAILIPAWRRERRRVIDAWPWRYFDPYALRDQRRASAGRYNSIRAMS